MHKKQTHRLLAMVLSIVMILSLVVIPAGAARPMGGEAVAETPAGAAPAAPQSGHTKAGLSDVMAGQISYVWNFSDSSSTFHEGATGTNKGEGTYGYLTAGAKTWDTLKISEGAGSYNTGYCYLANGGSVVVPVGQACNVAVTTQYGAKATVSGGSNPAVELVNGETTVFSMSDAGDVTIAATGTTYLTKIELLAYDAEPTLALSAASVDLQMSVKETATVTARLTNTTAAVAAESKDTGVVEASVTDKTVTLTAKGEGSTTVDVTVEGTALKETITVTVAAAPTGPVYVELGKSYNFTDAYKTEPTAGGTFIWGPRFDKMNGSHGVTSEESDNPTGEASVTMTLPEGKTADIILYCCMYGHSEATGITTDPAGLTVEETTKRVDQNTDSVYTVKNATGTVKIVFDLTAGHEYIHAIKAEEVVAPQDPSGTPGTVDVWDFGAELVTSQTVTFVNKLGADQAAIVTEINSWFKNPPTPGGANNNNTLGDFATTDGALTFDGASKTDWRLRVQNAPAGLTYRDKGSVRTGTVDPYFTEEVTYNGTIASNGGGRAGAYTLKNIAAGDKITYIHGEDGGGNYGANFVSGTDQAVALSGSGRVSADTVYATQTGNQKLTYNLGKGAMIRIYDEHPTTATITGTITAAEGFTGDVIFTNAQSNIAYTATATGGSYTVEVPNYLSGTSYNLSLSGDTQYFISSERTVTLAAGAATATANVTVGKIVAANVSGLVGPIDAAEAAKLKITLTPTDSTKVYVPEVTVTAQTTGDNATWSAQLEAGVEYTVAISNAPDYDLDHPVIIQESADATVNISLVATPVQSVIGKFVTLGADEQYKPLYPDSTYDALSATVTALSFKNVEDGYVYPATIADGGYTANLRSGSYEAVATVDGYATKGHVVVANSAVTKDLLFMPTAKPAAVDYVAELTVDPAGTGATNFKTITGALAYARRMTRPNNERVTIKIAAGTYREQLAIDIPNVTLEPATPGAEVVVTWYYGIGYAYYSPSDVNNTNSWYDAEKAFDKYALSKVTVARWGATVRVIATGFQAEGITFENSLNRYLTEEEMYDGVKLLRSSGGNPGDSQITVERTAQLDVKSKTATERGAAIWMDATNKRGDMAEFKNCKFYSSQDTVGTGVRSYFKDCYIEGMTDYICGPGTAVFDGCTLNWKGYTETDAAAGYITAPQTKNNNADDKGYLFVDCTVTADTDLHVNAGSWARVWGGKNAAVIFLNTELKSTATDGSDLINSSPWGEMNGVKPTEVPGIKEYGTHLTDGTAVAPKGPANTHMTQAEAEAVDMTTYFNVGGDWTPEYYEAKTPVDPDTPTTVADLEKAIEASKAAAAVPAVSADGSDVAATEKWVTETELKTYNDAIAAAEAVAKKADVTSDELKTALETLQAADKTFADAQEAGTLTSAAALTQAIANAKKLAEDTKVSEDGSDVPKRDMWVIQDVMTTFENAIKAAEEANVEGATEADLAAALATLNAAVKTFTEAQKEGTKRSTFSSGSTKPTTPVTEKKTNDNGDVATITTQPSGDKTITVVNKDGETVAEIKLPAKVSAPATKFKDVPDDHWAAKAINDMAGLGMVKGVNETNDIFDMNSSMTRAAVATMFFRLSNGQSDLESTFADVQGHWAVNEVAWAAKTGLVNGYSDEAFGPNDAITRQQLAMMLCRFANLIGMDTKAHTSALDVFTDADQADSWATDSLAWCVKNGVMQGRGDNTLDPKTNITRAEATAMFDRLIGLMK